MSPVHESVSTSAIERVVEAARSRESAAAAAGAPPVEVPAPLDPAVLAPALLRHVDADVLTARDPEAWVAAVVSQVDAATHRQPGSTTVRVAADGPAAGGPPGSSVLEVVTDDMPFLVDSVTMEVARQGRTTDLVVHPRVWARRSDEGRLLEIRPAAAGSSGARRPPEGFAAESWIWVETERISEAGEEDALTAGVRHVLDDVRAAVEDWRAMRDRVHEAAAALDVDDAGRDLLDWIAADHFTFLGAADLTVHGGEARPIAGTGLGIFRDGPGHLLPEAESVHAPAGTSGRALVVDKAVDRSTVHRPGNLDRLTVRTFDASGQVVAERRVLGLWSSRARSESVLRIPGLSLTVAEVLERAGLQPDEHAGKAAVDALEAYPRDELFAADVESLVPVAVSAAATGGSQRLRSFVRRDPRGRYVSVLVHLPRERYSSSVREQIATVLREMFAGDRIEFSARIDESRAARVHFVVHPPRGESLLHPADTDVEERLVATARSWRDELLAAAVDRDGAETGARRVRAWAGGLPEGYKESTPAGEAADDLAILEGLRPGEVWFRMVATDVASEHVPGGRRLARLKLCSDGAPVPLARVLPLLQSAGVEVVDERPHEVVGPRGPAWVYAFEMTHPADVPYASPDVFVAAVRAMWDGASEVDDFNTLVLEAGLEWRQVAVLRAYAAYLRQGRFPFTRESTVAALRANVEVARALATTFDVRFDPDREEGREVADAEASNWLDAALAAVQGREHDRILRAHRTVLDATLRTNHFRRDRPGAEHPSRGRPGLGAVADEGPRAHLALKIAPREVPGLPEPRPAFEVYVHSPQVEGVHLRFGAVARGGLRWSDRRDDFRTEVLGLVKAQMVKNSVIVPVGAKGGFVAKQLPDPQDRAAFRDEGVASYRAFISCLLDVTDNLVDGQVVGPPRVVRRDGDDHYLVVAADKGTATFSDIANALATDYGFWLDDAFASGGSVGYDHKGMGITARGAWVSVQRHFRERGVDVQSEPFTCVGIGDMSGDVFGNGLLCSPSTRLLAAFDHRDVFLDPDPDPASSYAERRRLFETPRSSWQDYDPDLISEGGGVFSRSSKSIPLSPQVVRALGMDEGTTQASPDELIRAVLCAPVDLLWNGGIGTYVKASHESHADVGDAANDAIRVDGRDLRVRAVGEGGNLGLTQAGRVELARTRRARGGDAGGTVSAGAVNTDFIDNSAGVDTSDHEVNIKILLDAVVAAGAIDAEQRVEVLASMTDEVGDLVLAHNYAQNLTLADEAAAAAASLHVHEQWMRRLEERGVLDRGLESLPSRTDVRRRRESGEGLSVPELSVLVSWTKIVMAGEVLSSGLPDDPYLRGDLIGYFPSALRQERRAQMLTHPLRREIITTRVVNRCVDEAGVTAWMRARELSGADAATFVLAHLVVGELLGTTALRQAIAELDHRVDASVQTDLRAAVRRVQEEATHWLLARGTEIDADEVVDAFSVPVQRLVAQMPNLLLGATAQACAERREGWEQAGVPDALAATVAVLPECGGLLDMVRTSALRDRTPEQVARVHLALGDDLGIAALRAGLVALPRTSRWESSAAGALADDLDRAHAELTGRAVQYAEPTAERALEWLSEVGGVDPVRDLVAEVLEEGAPDLARASVAVRAVRGLVQES